MSMTTAPKAFIIGTVAGLMGSLAGMGGGFGKCFLRKRVSTTLTATCLFSQAMHGVEKKRCSFHVCFIMKGL